MVAGIQEDLHMKASHGMATAILSYGFLSYQNDKVIISFAMVTSC